MREISLKTYYSFLANWPLYNAGGAVNLLIVIILFFVFSSILLVSFLMINRVLISLKRNRDFVFKKQIQNPIAEILLFNCNDEPEDRQLLAAFIQQQFHDVELVHDWQKELVLNELLSLKRDLTGSVAIRLELIYRSLHLQVHSAKKLRSSRWYILASGIREVAELNGFELIDDLLRLINHDEAVVRAEAQLAVVKLSRVNHFNFLDELTYDLSDWQQIHLHHILESIPTEELPVFTTWLNHPNETVTLFCLKMIGYFTQAKAIPQVLELLYHSNPKIVNQSILTLTELNAYEATSTLIELFESKPTGYLKNQLLISFAQLGDIATLPYLTSYLDKDQVEQNLLICKAILACGLSGKTTLQNLKEQPPFDSLPAIIDHVLDPLLTPQSC